MGEQLLTIKTEMVGLPSVMSDNIIEVLTKQFAEDSHLQFQNFCVNFHKFRALFSMRLAQLG
jgi:hypothetical protein